MTSITKHPSHPFHTLLFNLTRRINDTKSIPYLILLQYSSSLNLRLTASDISADTSSRNRSRKNEVPEDQIYKFAGITNPTVVAQRDLCGSLLIKEALRECINFCDGFVILVSTLGWRDDDTCSKRWVEHGVIVDLSLNPFEWDDEHQVDIDSVVQSKDGKVRKMTARLDSLQSILSTIRQAVAIIQKLRNKENDETVEESHPAIKPIPIIFDSLSLLLRFNGPHNVISFLNNLKRCNTLSNDSSLTSPLFIPVLNEVLSQSEHRLFEDLSDATLTVKNGMLLIARRSTRSGGMFSSSLGPCGRKLVREAQKFEISQEGNIQWTVLENDDETRTENTANKSQSMNSGPKESIIKPSVSGRNDKVMLLNDDGPRHSNNSTSIFNDTKPQIYMETDDPEFNDLDEEEPDDDLDL